MANISRHLLLARHLQLYLLCFTGSKCIPEKLDCCRGVYKPTVWAHHQSKQATQLLHEGNVSFLLQQKSCQRKVESFTYLCTVDLLIKLSNTGIKYFNLKEQLSKKSLKHQKWKFAEILTYIKIYKWQLIQHFNTTPRLQNTHWMTRAFLQHTLRQAVIEHQSTEHRQMEQRLNTREFHFLVQFALF